MKKIAVIGARGRMGAQVARAVAAAPDLELVAELDAGDELTAESLAGAQMAVEFTVPAASFGNVSALLELGLDVVVGTTGWGEEDLAKTDNLARTRGRAALIAPNFALSAVLAMHFASQAARFFESVEVIEMHHPAKLDAPSGTAMTTAQRIAAARRQANCPPLPDATEADPLGARGAKVDGVPVHAVRLRGLTAHEEILLGNPGEQLVIRSDCFDRESFMPGVLLALRNLGGRVGLTFGLDQLLDLRC